ncbi:MAG: hypothetical protein AB1626_03355, partial [Candidatus Micrarchaeota archaeon]
MVFTERASRNIPTRSARPVSHVPQPAPKGKITVSFAFEFDDYFKYRLIYVVAIVFLLALTFFMFSRADFKMTDLFDFGRLQYTLEKLYSISAILYAVLFSLSLAAATYYGFKLKKWQSLVALPVTLLVAFLFSYVYPQFYMPFLAMAITVAAAAFFASFAKEVNGTYATETLSHALLIFIVLAFIFTYSMVESQKETRFNQFFQGISEMALKQMASPAAPSLAASLVVPEFNASELVQDALDRNDTRAFVAQEYNARRDAFLGPFEGRSYFADLASSVHTFEELPSSEQEEMVDSLYAFAANQSEGFEEAIGESITSQITVSNATA